MTLQTKAGTPSSRRRLGALTAIALCSALITVGGASIATGEPIARVAASPLKIAKKALRIARGANARSKKALSVANQALSQAGQPGPQGPPGPEGPQGDQGPAGADGAEGPPGANVFVEAEPAGANCPEGGVKVSSAVSGIFYVCDGRIGADGADGATGPQGPEGSPWTAGGTLPPGETLSGTWSVGPFEATATGDSSPNASISFGIPLAAPPSFFEGNFNGQGFDGGGAGSCPGSASAPAAAPGQLCVYTTFQQNLAAYSCAFGCNDGKIFWTIIGTQEAANGAVFRRRAADPDPASPAPFTAEGYGTWAVTAHTP